MAPAGQALAPHDCRRTCLPAMTCTACIGRPHRHNLRSFPTAGVRDPHWSCLHCTADTMQSQQRPVGRVVIRRGKACCPLVLLRARPYQGTYLSTAIIGRAANVGSVQPDYLAELRRCCHVTADTSAGRDAFLDERIRRVKPDAQPPAPSPGRYILYWMRTAVRGHENPALDVAR